MPTPQLHPQTLQPLFGAEQFVAVHNFLNPSLVSALATDVESLRQRGLANTKASTPAHGSVEWLMLQPDPPPPSDEDDEFGITGRECLFEFVDALRLQIEEQTGVALDAHCELKYAHYPCGGRYQRHVDGMNVGTVSREYSFLLYLNEDWRASDGGWLRAFDLGSDGGHVDVAPAAGTLVVFKSDVVPHEVRPTTARRLAVVGWLHRHVPPCPGPAISGPRRVKRDAASRRHIRYSAAAAAAAAAAPGGATTRGARGLWSLSGASGLVAWAMGMASSLASQVYTPAGSCLASWLGSGSGSGLG